MSETRKLAEQLIELPSVTPDDGGCQSLLAKRLSQAGFSIDYLNFEDVSNLWAVIGDSGPLFTFVGHTDVVPPGPIESWDSAPFTPTVRDKFLFGRGAADMKSSLAAMVTAIERFLANNTLNFKLAYLVTSDEEGPAINGIKRVIEAFDSIDLIILRRKRIKYYQKSRGNVFLQEMLLFLALERQKEPLKQLE